MEKQFENITEITDRKAYDEAVKYLNEVVDYATENGYFAEQGADNEYTTEFGRIAGMCADYESLYMDLRPLKFKTPLIVSIEKEMRKKHLNQRQTAEILEIKENTFSQIMSGKRNVSMKLAKKLYHTGV
ncbi:helix-turn-helix domain-containing protein [Sphingobacterium haloxyli]|uniref:Transcriptional regulator n=1 Tax=Sphingobacterium haloxyli TaxID=2100533 RepID=A0A2S9J8E6_9SPHI|nr:helix-turn-helix transcriptional regulator [Sphingobacterium haloxyli]PRD49042.1 transcriptional regulator [Sphingobacterium haloxyli]